MTNKPVRIIRGIRDSDNLFFVSPRAAAQDRELSWESRGMLWYLLSKPDDWVLQPKDLMQGCGRDKVYKVLAELIAHGYIVREEVRGDNQKFVEFIYRVYEKPLPENQELGAKGETEPLPDSPDTALPDTANTDITNKENNTDKDSAPKSGADADSPETQLRMVKAPKPRNPMFDAVAEHVFGITSAEQLKQMDADEQAGTRIGMIVSWLGGKKDRFTLGNSKKQVSLGFISSPAKPEHVALFMQHVRSKGMTEIRDVQKFVEHWRAWASSMRSGQIGSEAQALAEREARRAAAMAEEQAAAQRARREMSA